MVDGGDLARGRAAARRAAWAEAHAALSAADESGALLGEDLELLATAAYLRGHGTQTVQVLHRAHEAYLEEDNPRRAARCIFWMGLTLMLAGDVAQGGGWLARATRLVEGEQECAEQGLLMLPGVFHAMEAGDVAAARVSAAQAAELGARVGDPDLLAFAQHWQGRALVQAGSLGAGMALLDEAMVSVVATEVAPFVAGSIYCSMIDACQEVSDWRRAQEWTAALTAWWANQPEMITFTGQCLTHRAEIMHLRGEWSDAVEEATRACRQLARGADAQATGAARYRLGEIHRTRGTFAAAQVEYEHASRWGHEPQPGLALLRLAEGNIQTAEAMICRVVEETSERVRRTKLLPAQVEILLAAGDVSAARVAADELAGLTAVFDTRALCAAADHATGAVHLAEGDARAALGGLRRAWQVWRGLDAPYEAARVRVLVALGCRALGDEESAALELDAARRVFIQLGAGSELARINLLTPSPVGADEHGLTARELQVLRLLAAGRSNHAIAGDLVVAAKTVDRHVTNIYAKLGVSSRAAATAYAYEHGLV